MIDNLNKGPITQAWTHELSAMQQTVLITAVRGPDGIPKYHAVKYLLRWYRRCVLRSSLDGCILDNPHDPRGGSFMGPSYNVSAAAPLSRPWGHEMSRQVSEYLRALDELPQHFQLHLMHATEIVGYKHPDLVIREFWSETYLRLVNDMHGWPESEAELDARLGDDRAAWSARRCNPPRWINR